MNELEKLLAEATPGPWRVSPQRSTATEGGQPSPYNGFLKMTSDSWDGSDNGSSEANAALICAAVNALPELLAERDRLREALVQADLKIRSFPRADQSDVEFIRAALNQETKP